MQQGDGKLNRLNDGISHPAANGVKLKKQKRGKCDLGADFVAPDGGKCDENQFILF